MNRGRLALLFGVLIAAGTVVTVASWPQQRHSPAVRVLDRRCRGGCTSVNLFTKTENLTGAPWANDATVTTAYGSPGGVLSPTGTATVSCLTPTTSDSYVFQTVNSASAQLPATYDVSLWVRLAAGNAGGGSLILHVDNGVGGQRGDLSITPTAVWTRYSISSDMSGAAHPGGVRLLLGGFTGGWDVTLGALCLWGAQGQVGPLGPYKAVP